MFKGWFQYGDTEVVNNDRVIEYVANGLTPVGAKIGACTDCPDLAEANGEPAGYQTPALDDAPWFTPTDPDSADFAGVMAVDVTGLSGSTITTEISERVGDGGIAGTRRAESRVIQVTADVVGRTPEATAIGIEWLSSVLHPPCAESADCKGDILHLYSTCPSTCDGITDPDAPFATTSVTGVSSFQTGGLTSTNTSITSIALNPSVEDASVSPWSTSTAFGAFVAATAITKVAPPVTLNRANAVRVTTPAMSAGQRTNVTFPISIPSAGIWEFSVWVYVPTATATRVIAGDLFAGNSAEMGAKDDWVRITLQESCSVATAWFAVWTDPTQIPATGSFFYVDGATVTKVGSLPSSSNFQGDAADVDSWGSNSVFGNFEPAASIATEAFAGPTPEALPRVLKITWGWPLTGATGKSIALVAPDGMIDGQVYTYEADLYVPTGSPDVFTDVLFNGLGTSYSTKDAWFHVRHTFRYDGFGIFALQAIPTGAGQFVRVSNVRLMPGFGTMQRLSYFDGASQDFILAPTKAAAAATGTGVLTTGVVGPDGEIWTELAAPAANDGARVNVTLAELVDYSEYIGSWLLHNPGADPVNVLVDWSNGTATAEAVQPGETKRVIGIGARDYDATFRFTDLQLPDAGESILFRDVRVEPLAPYNYTWTGAAETTTSTAAPMGDDFVFQPTDSDSTIMGPVFPGVCDTVVIEWVVSSGTGTEFYVVPAISNPGGVVSYTGDPVLIGQTPVSVRLELESTPNSPDDWRPVLTSDGHQFTVHSLEVTSRPVLTLDECVGPYRRTFQNVVTASGPTIIEDRTLGDTTIGSTVARVEWTWVALSPNAWHDTVPILTGVPGKTAGDAVYKAPGVPLSAADGTIGGVATTCARPAVSLLSCADNSACASLILPPAAPVLADPCVMTPALNAHTPNTFTRRNFEIPADLSPIGVGALSWTFANDATPKLGVRVRIYEDVDPAFAHPSECTFVEEFTINFLAANQTLYIDGTSGEVYTFCGTDVFGNPIRVNALRNLSGNYGGPFKNSVIGCGRPYFISVDIPNLYTGSITGFTNGNSQGTLTWSVDLTRRA